jgi:hypothetical protein
MADSPAQVHRLPARPGPARPPLCRARPGRAARVRRAASWACRPAGLGLPSPASAEGARYAFSEQEVKQYFTEPKVLSGLFRIIETLFEVRIRPTRRRCGTRACASSASSATGSWSASSTSTLRPHRQAPGAWMDDVRGRWLRPDRRHCRRRWRTWSATSPRRRRQAGAAHARRRHHAVPRVRPRPAPHADAGRTTLGVSGISGVEWDAVELPSQFMENFCWEWDVLKHMTAHVDTGEPLPRALFDKMLAAKNFQSGMQTLRQVEFSLFDMRCTPSPAREDASSSARRGARRGRGAARRVQPLPAQLLAHLRRRLRGRLLQLQVGRGAVGRCLERVRGDRPARLTSRRAGATAKRFSNPAAAARNGKLQGLPRPRAAHRCVVAPPRAWPVANDVALPFELRQAAQRYPVTLYTMAG